jgi:4-hydroxyphenylpyruvate dioxygenase
MAAKNLFACTTATFGGTFEERLTAIKNAGFAGVELYPCDLFVRFIEPEDAVDVFKKSGLGVCCYQHLGNFEGSPIAKRDVKLNLARQLMDQMAMVGADLLMVSANKNADVIQDWGRAVEDFRMLGELGKARNIKIGFEALAISPWFNDYRKVWKLVQDVNHSHVGVALDATHTFLANVPLEPISDIPGDRIFLVEIADLPTTNLPIREVSRYHRIFPGEGVRPVAEFVQRSLATGYKGYISVELFSTHYSSMDAKFVADRAFQSVNRLLS